MKIIRWSWEYRIPYLQTDASHWIRWWENLHESMVFPITMEDQPTKWLVYGKYGTYIRHIAVALFHCGKFGSFFGAMPVKHDKLPLTSEIEYESWTCITPEGHRRLPLKTLFYDPCWFWHISVAKSLQLLHEHHSKTRYPSHRVLRYSTIDPPMLYKSRNLHTVCRQQSCRRFLHLVLMNVQLSQKSKGPHRCWLLRQGFRGLSFPFFKDKIW